MSKSTLLFTLGILVAGAMPAHAINVGAPCANGAAGLVAAIQQVQVTGDASNTLTLDVGCTYTLVAVNNTSGDGSPNGLPTLTRTLLVVGRGAIIQRDQAAPAFRLWRLESAANLTLRDVAMRNGLARGANGQNATPPGGVATPGGTFSGLGGAILSRGATLTIERTTFENNQAVGGNGGSGYNGSCGGGGGGGMGGALFLDLAPAPPSGSVLVNQSAFVMNAATGGIAGDCGGGSPNTSGGGGGGLGGDGGWRTFSPDASGLPTDGGFGGGGGAAANVSGAPRGGLGGFAGGGGGGFGFAAGGAYGGTSANNGFSGGGGGGLGGGVFVNGVVVSIINSTFSQNAATGGVGGLGGQGGSGAGAGVFERDGSVAIANVTFSANAASGANGGPPINTSAAGGNGSGGNIERFGGTLILAASIVADGAVAFGTGNNAPNGTAGDPDVRAVFTSQGFNLVETRGSSTGYIAADLAPADPQLQALASVAGSFVHVPSASSPVINAIGPASCGQPVDQLGTPRPQGAGCEVGAVEVRPDALFANGFE